MTYIYLYIIYFLDTILSLLLSFFYINFKTILLSNAADKTNRLNAFLLINK